MPLGKPTVLADSMKPSDPGPVDVCKVSGKPKNARVPYVAWEYAGPGCKYRLVVIPCGAQTIIEESTETDALGVDAWHPVDKADRDLVIEAMSKTLIEHHKRGRVPITK